MYEEKKQQYLTMLRERYPNKKMVDNGNTIQVQTTRFKNARLGFIADVSTEEKIDELISKIDN